MKKAWARALEKRFEIALAAILAMFLVIWQPEAHYAVVLVIGYLVLVWGLNNEGVEKGIVKGLKDIRKERLSGIFILTTIALLCLWEVSTLLIFFVSLFLAFVVYGWDSRVVMGGTVFSLISCVAFLLAGQEGWAEQMAVCAYYFFAVSAVLYVVGFRYSSKIHKENEITE
jgi:hypothetical protein